jgi:NADH dehydrogenase
MSAATPPSSAPAVGAGRSVQATPGGVLGRDRRPHVVIVGGGFGGLNAARALQDAPVRITLVDRRNHHLFQPLLYQVATAALSPADIASPIRAILRRQKNVQVLLAEATAVDLAARALVLDSGRLAYDFLILAAGAGHSYFGHDEWAAAAPGLKSLEEALDIRRRILVAYEEAERTTDPAAQEALMTFVVVGAGPTGVELAGALAEIARFALARDFDQIDPTRARIYLLEGASRVLLAFPEPLARRAQRDLENLGVEVRLDCLVTEITPAGVTAGGEFIPARTVLWAAGVQGAPLGKTLGVELDRAGRVVVNPDLTLPGHPDVFCIGDLSFVDAGMAAGKDERGRPLPGTAPVAIQQGRWAAENIRRALRGDALQPFRYRDRGNMATIGRNKAVADLRGLKLTGFVAWVAWAVIHIFSLIGFRNRILVSFQWLVAYVTYQRGARLITEEPGRRE